MRFKSVSSLKLTGFVGLKCTIKKTYRADRFDGCEYKLVRETVARDQCLLDGFVDEIDGQFCPLNLCVGCGSRRFFDYNTMRKKLQ